MNYRSNGKLLITGEYLVLKGARSLAIPTSFGQEMQVENHENSLLWTTKVQNNKVFSAEFNLVGECLQTDDSAISDRLSEILKVMLELKNEDVFNGQKITSFLDFPMTWGLGSSSTLINNLASWFGLDPFALLSRTFGGSAYDIACARANGPIVYSIKEDRPYWEEVAFYPDFHESLYFVYLNRKKDSREAMKHFNSLALEDIQSAVNKLNDLTSSFLKAADIKDFGQLIGEHEDLISNILREETIKKQLFNDYPHAIKSLGGWGGDFVMAIGNTDEMTYFRNKGYNTIIPFNKMILRDSVENA